MERLSGILVRSCVSPNFGHYEGDIENGIVPSGIKVVEQDDAGLAPYSFLDLP